MTKQNLFSFLLAFLVLGLCQVSTAQISIGVRGGISLNNMDVEPIDDDEPQPENILDFQFAVPVEIAIGDMFAVQPEIMFASHGFKQSDNSTATEGGFTSRTNYNNELKVRALEVPVLGKVKFGPENIKFHVLAGPSFGFGIGGEGKVKGDVEVTDVGGVVVFSESYDDTYKAKFIKDGYDPADVDEDEIPLAKTNLNLHFGAGLSFNVGTASLFLDGRYILGLSDMVPDADGTDKNDEITGKSNRIAVSVGVMLPLN